MRISDWSSDVCSSDLRPDAARDAADHRVFGVHAVREEEAEVRREVVDLHAAREVRLDVREAVAERERELADRIRAGFGDVIAGDRHRVEILDPVLDEILLDVAHHLQRELGAEDAGRSEEHTSELQSLMRNSYAVFCLKKKKKK